MRADGCRPQSPLQRRWALAPQSQSAEAIANYGPTAGASMNSRHVRNSPKLSSLVTAPKTGPSSLGPFLFWLRDNNADGVLNRAVRIFFLQTMHERHTWANPCWNRRRHIDAFLGRKAAHRTTGGDVLTVWARLPSSVLRPSSVIVMR